MSKGLRKRQTFAHLRQRKSLRLKSSKPFAENTFRTFKALRHAADTVTDPNDSHVPHRHVARARQATGSVFIGPRNGPTVLAQYTVRTAGADPPFQPATESHA